MSKAKDFLNFIYTPKEIYAILDKFGYNPGNLLIKSVLQKGYAEKREHKIFLTKLGKAKLSEIESLKNKPAVEIQPVQQITAPAGEYNKTASFWILGIIGLLGFIVSIWQVSSSKVFMPYGIIAILFLISFILAIVLFFKR
ncbi:hypothetical protein HYS72_03505 [Candidatus Pacearchaeota archaeon]|nr:hypothetical protein [Candidatus Pacearchaeota archaeon]